MVSIFLLPFVSCAVQRGRKTDPTSAWQDHSNMQYFGHVEIGTPPKKFKVVRSPCVASYHRHRASDRATWRPALEQHAASTDRSHPQVVFDTGSFVLWVPDGMCSGTACEEHSRFRVGGAQTFPANISSTNSHTRCWKCFTLFAASIFTTALHGSTHKLLSP